MRFLSTERHPDIDAVRTAWRGFVEGGSPPAQPVREYVWRAWQRSQAAGCDARLPRAHMLQPHETQSLLRLRAPLLDVGSPFLEALSRAAAGERHAAMLADADGRLLRLAGDEQTMADENFPRPGSLLSEAYAGANGVGTALAEQGYVELVGPEHYIEGFHAFTCQGVPLQGPSGLMGVLSMSVRRQETADRVRDILFCASEAAECELLARWMTQATADVRAPLLEQLRQDIVQGITVARLRLEVAARQLAAGASAEQTIDATLRLTGQFARQAVVWRDLALDEPAASEPEVLDLADTVDIFMALMQTEARVMSLHFEWKQAERLPVLTRRHALSRRLLGTFLTAMQGAMPGSRLQVQVSRQGGLPGVALQELDAQGLPRARHVLSVAPLH